MANTKLIVALDVDDPVKLREFARLFLNEDVLFKVGLEFILAFGVSMLQSLIDPARLMLDVKLADKGLTVERALASVFRHYGAPAFVTLYGLGGIPTIVAARHAVDNAHVPTRLLAVTILTDWKEADYQATLPSGVQNMVHISTAVRNLAVMALGSGAHGVVGSPLETGELRRVLPPTAPLVTVGIRPAGVPAMGQKRLATPTQAAQSGATHVVVGSPITGSPDPLAALRAMRVELINA